MPEPTATPAAPPPAQTAPAPAATPAATPKPSSSPFFDEIDALAAPKKEAAAEAPKPSTSDTSATGADKSPEKTTTSSEDHASDTQDSSAKDAAKTGNETSPKPFKAAELRTAYENLKREHSKLKQDFERAKTEKPKEDPERKTLVETLDAREKRIKELEEELTYTSFERSQEYKDKYEKPFIDAYQAGRARAAALKVMDADGNPRQGTAADFDRIMGMQDDDQAADAANEMFGTKASLVLYHRERVQEMNRNRVNAIEDHQKNGAEREKTRIAERAKQEEQSKAQREKLNGMFTKHVSDAVERYPKYFKPVDGDDKGNELLEKGFKMADLAFNPGNMAPEKVVELHAAIRNKAAGFDRVVYLLKKGEDRIGELEKELAQFKGSETAGGTTKRPTGDKPLTVDDEIDAMATQRR